MKMCAILASLMNLSLVTISVLQRSAAVAVIAAGALFGTSCTVFSPAPPPPPPATGPFRYGYGGTNSPNYERRAQPGQREIKRDPNDDNVNIEPPPPRDEPTPPAEATPPGTPPPAPPPIDTPPAPKPSAKEDLPYGIPVVGKKGYVYSPFAEDRGQVDVEGLKRGTRVKCPYTGKHFRVP
jgi:hypothetical protein